MNSTNFEAIARYFHDVDRKTFYVYNRGVRTSHGGCLIVSNLRELKPSLDELVERRIVSVSGLFHDAGYNDGRIVAQFNGDYGISSTGSEIDQLLAANGQHHIDELHTMGVVNGVKLAHGDFGNEKNYKEGLGINVGDIQTFFNFQNNPHRLAKIVARRSPKGTVFLLVCHSEQHVEYDDLEHTMTLDLNSRSRWAKYLHVYTKNGRSVYPLT